MLRRGAKGVLKEYCTVDEAVCCEVCIDGCTDESPDSLPPPNLHANTTHGRKDMPTDELDQD